MNTTQQLVVNKLPTRTWNHLNVNEATIPWNVAETADLGTDAYEITAENQAQPLHIRLTGAEGYSRKHIAVDVAAGVQATVYMVLDAQGSFAVETALTLHDRASLRLVQMLGAQVGALLYAKTNADCAPDAGVAMTQILMGQGRPIFGQRHGACRRRQPLFGADRLSRPRQSDDRRQRRRQPLWQEHGVRDRHVRRAQGRGEEGFPRHDRL